MMEEAWLERAVALARTSAGGEGGPFGAVVVRDGELLGEGANRVTADDDPTAHAEVVALRRACAAVGSHELSGAVLYASCEPCPMCLAASLWARVDMVVYAADRSDAAAAGFSDQEFYDLFDKPREAWTHLRVVRQRLASAAAPFEAWRVNVGREDY